MRTSIATIVAAVMAVPTFSNAFSIQTTEMPRSSTILRMSSVAASPIGSSKATQLKTALKKPSKVLTVGVEYVHNDEAEENEILSMQLRKSKVSSIWCSNIDDVSNFAKEQETAKGNFPGPCPVIYDAKIESNDDIQSAVTAGATAITVDANTIETITSIWNEEVPLEIIWKIANAQDVEKVSEVTGGDLADAAFLIRGDMASDDIEAISSALPKSSLLIASVDPMQSDGNEVSQGKQLKALGVASILVNEACVGDAEDMEYSRFLVEGLTSKASSEFKFSGLTGSTNGHFGGVQSNGTVKWRRGGES